MDLKAGFVGRTTLRTPASSASARVPGWSSSHVASLRQNSDTTPAPRSVMCRVSPQGNNVLVGDIGGTNARLSIWKSDGPPTGEVFAKTYPTAKYATFEAVMEEFLAEAAAVGSSPATAALAIAGAVEDNRCAMTNLDWIVDGRLLTDKFGIKTQLLNDFEAVGYGIPVLQPEDVVTLNDVEPIPHAPKVVMGPGTGLGAAQLMWDTGLQDYKVWPGEGAHATFAPRGWKQMALGSYAAVKLGGHVEVEHVACGSGLELIYEFLLSDEPGNRQSALLGSQHIKSAAQITTAALAGGDALAEEACDMLMNIVGAEAGAMSLRCLAHGGIYIAGGITPRLLPRLLGGPQKGGALMEGIMCRKVRSKFKAILEAMPVAVITNEKVGQVGARQVAIKLMERDEL